MANNDAAEQPALDDTAGKADGDQQAPPQATADVNALRSSLRESTSRLQYPEPGEWTTEDLENIELAGGLKSARSRLTRPQDCRRPFSRAVGQDLSHQ
jgi:hypothetical protein